MIWGNAASIDRNPIARAWRVGIQIGRRQDSIKDTAEKSNATSQMPASVRGALSNASKRKLLRCHNLNVAKLRMLHDNNYRQLHKGQESSCLVYNVD